MHAKSHSHSSFHSLLKLFFVNEPQAKDWGMFLSILYWNSSVTHRAYDNVHDNWAFPFSIETLPKYSDVSEELCRPLPFHSLLKLFQRACGGREEAEGTPFPFSIETLLFVRILRQAKLLKYLSILYWNSSTSCTKPLRVSGNFFPFSIETLQLGVRKRTQGSWLLLSILYWNSSLHLPRPNPWGSGLLSILYWNSSWDCQMLADCRSRLSLSILYWNSSTSTSETPPGKIIAIFPFSIETLLNLNTSITMETLILFPFSIETLRVSFVWEAWEVWELPFHSLLKLFGWKVYVVLDRESKNFPFSIETLRTLLKAQPLGVNSLDFPFSIETLHNYNLEIKGPLELDLFPFSIETLQWVRRVRWAWVGGCAFHSLLKLFWSALWKE